MAIYLKFGSVKGNVTADGFTGQIALLTAEFEGSRKVTMETGNLSNRESGKPNLTPFQITKQADSSAAGLFKEFLTGSAAQEAVLSFVRTGSSKVEEYLSYKLSNCIVSYYRLSGQDEGHPIENIELSYSAIEASYKDHDASNKAGNPQRVAYDIKGAKMA